MQTQRNQTFNILQNYEKKRAALFFSDHPAFLFDSAVHFV